MAEQSQTEKNSQSARNELVSFAERMERLNADAKAIADDKKEVMAEVKGRGYDAKIFRKVMAERARDKDDLAEEFAIIDMYREALGVVSSFSDNYGADTGADDSDETSDIV